MMTMLKNIISLFLLVATTSFLSGCGGDQHGDLKEYVEQVKARQKGRIQPLPDVRPYESFSYAAGDLRNPFSPFVQESVESIDNGLSPDLNRKREALEQFPLDTLVFVGHIEKKGILWGLIAAPDDTVYRVQAGNHMGKNYGEILSISETSILLKEIISDGTGGWVDRETTMTISQ